MVWSHDDRQDRQPYGERNAQSQATNEIPGHSYSAYSAIPSPYAAASSAPPSSAGPYVVYSATVPAYSQPYQSYGHPEPQDARIPRAYSAQQPSYDTRNPVSYTGNDGLYRNSAADTPYQNVGYRPADDRPYESRNTRDMPYRATAEPQSYQASYSRAVHDRSSNGQNYMVSSSGGPGRPPPYNRDNTDTQDDRGRDGADSDGDDQNRHDRNGRPGNSPPPPPRRAPTRNDHPIIFFVPGEKVNLEVMVAYLRTYIDPTASIRPSQHPTNPSLTGYTVTSRTVFKSPDLKTIINDSADWEEESATRAARREGRRFMESATWERRQRYLRERQMGKPKSRREDDSDG